MVRAEHAAFWWVLLVFAVLGHAVTGTANATTTTDLPVRVNAVRAQLGLEALRDETALQATADEVATTLRRSGRAPRNIGLRYRARGGEWKLRISYVEPGLSVEDNMLQMPQVGAAMLDSRTRTIAVRQVDPKRLLVTLGHDPDAVLQPVVWPTLVDATARRPLLVLDNAPGAVSLKSDSDSFVVSLQPGFGDGAPLHLASISRELGPDTVRFRFATTYRVSSPSATTSVRVRGATGDWHFDQSMTSQQRRVFRRLVAAAPTTSARRAVYALRSQVEIRAGAGRGGHDCTRGGLSCTTFGRGRYVLILHPAHLQETMVARFVVWHELAHVMDFALSDRDADLIRRALRRQPGWACFRSPLFPGRCVPTSEVLADQISLWALDLRTTHSGYGVPRFVSAARVHRWLDLWLRPRPAPWTP